MLFFYYNTDEPRKSTIQVYLILEGFLLNFQQKTT